jgi:hypothetical protein
MTAADPVPPRDLYSTSELRRRVPKVIEHLGKKACAARRRGADAGPPQPALPKLVERAMQMTGAASAGSSLFDRVEGTAGVFRWINLHGVLAQFEGAR